MQSSPHKNRKYSVNEQYFNTIDTPEKAYWLGLLWADGNISKTTPRSSSPNRLRLSLKADESHHLELLQTHLQSDHPLKKSVSSYNSQSVVLDVNSRPLCEALESLGFGLKSERTNIPEIDHLSHFIRGYFDGDGSLSLYTQKVKDWTIHRQEWSLTGEPEFIINVQDFLSKALNLSNTKLKKYKRTDKAITLRYGKISDIRSLYDYLYQDASIYMNSKHQKFVEFLSIRGE